MAQTANVNFRLDEDVKKNMDQVCSDLGLSMTAAFTLFAKKVGREKRIPFEVSLQGSDPFYSESNLQRLEKIADDIRRGTAKLVEHDLLDEN